MNKVPYITPIGLLFFALAILINGMLFGFTFPIMLVATLSFWITNIVMTTIMNTYIR